MDLHFAAGAGFIGTIVEIRRQRPGCGDQLIIRGVVRGATPAVTLGGTPTGELTLWIENDTTHKIERHSTDGFNDLMSITVVG